LMHQVGHSSRLPGTRRRIVKQGQWHPLTDQRIQKFTSPVGASVVEYEVVIGE
jgi:hypothetical protein